MLLVAFMPSQAWAAGLGDERCGYTTGTTVVPFLNCEAAVPSTNPVTGALFDTSGLGAIGPGTVWWAAADTVVGDAAWSKTSGVSASAGGYDYIGTYAAGPSFRVALSSSLARTIRLYRGVDTGAAAWLVGATWTGVEMKLPKYSTVMVPPPAPSIKASVCVVGSGFISVKGSWTVDNGLTVIYQWAGGPPLKGWYWYAAAPGKLITAASMPRGPIPREA